MYLYKLKPGIANNRCGSRAACRSPSSCAVLGSYGLKCAGMAGVPDRVLKRAAKVSTAFTSQQVVLFRTFALSTAVQLTRSVGVCSAG